MVKITYIAADGEARTVDAKPGQSVMEAAVKNGVEGIVGECGGSCTCATCRVYVPEDWRARTGEAGEMEREMIGFSEDEHPDVRLSCQIRVSEALDGLVVHMPNSQH